MNTTGVYEPETADAVKTAYENVGSVAQIVTKETTRAMGFDSVEYDERVTGDVIETARDAVFASLLTTYHGSREEFETWCEGRSFDVIERHGSENVDRVVWHPVVCRDTVVSASYQHEREAAAATVRRRAFGRYYRELL